MSFNEHLSGQLKKKFSDYANKGSVEVIALATADGFPIYTLNKVNSSFEEDSLSAAASTLHSVSNAVAQQILGKRFKVTFIEAEQGNVAFISIQLNGSDYVLVMSAKSDMNIASLRLLINRLANEIGDLKSEAASA